MLFFAVLEYNIAMDKSDIIDESDENIQTKTLESFKEYAVIKQIFSEVVEHSKDTILLEADLEKLTGL